MKTGFEALSHSLSLWPEFNRNNPQFETISDSLSSLQDMRGSMATAEKIIFDFHAIVNSLPRLTGSLNTGKRTACSALQQLVDVLQTQQRVISNIEELALGILVTHAGVMSDQAADQLNVAVNLVRAYFTTVC